jgi:transposase InsO family protein
VYFHTFCAKKHSFLYFFQPKKPSVGVLTTVTTTHYRPLKPPEKDRPVIKEMLELHVRHHKYIADRCRIDYNHYRPHSSVDYMVPAAFAVMRLEQGEQL